MRGKGIPDLHGRGKGDQLIKVNVKIPTSLTSEQRKIIAEFAKASGENIETKESFDDKVKKAFK